MDAHARNDVDALAGLYADAAALTEVAGDVDATCFYLTQAYVFALSAGLPIAATINRKLVAFGRDELQSDL